jgi:hypothetical protein
LRPPKRALPDVAFEDLVVVVGEANAWPYDAGHNSQRDELVHWLAMRVATGETFSMIARPERPISPTTSFHTKLSEDTLLAGAPRTEVFDAFRAWSRPTDVIASWGHYGPSLVLDAGGSLPSTRVDLRAAAQRFESKKLGTLDEYAASLGFVARSALARGSVPDTSAAAVGNAVPWNGDPSPSQTRSNQIPTTVRVGTDTDHEVVGDLDVITPGRGGERLAMLAHIVRAWRALDESR